MRQNGPCPHDYSYIDDKGVQWSGLTGDCDCDYSQDEVDGMVEFFAEIIVEDAMVEIFRQSLDNPAV